MCLNIILSVIPPYIEELHAFYKIKSINYLSMNLPNRRKSLRRIRLNQWDLRRSAKGKFLESIPRRPRGSVSDRNGARSRRCQCWPRCTGNQTRNSPRSSCRTSSSEGRSERSAWSNRLIFCWKLKFCFRCSESGKMTYFRLAVLHWFNLNLKCVWWIYL